MIFPHLQINVFPLIKKAVPNAVFTVIGAEPPENILALADGKNIIVTGFVDDLQEEYKEARVVVVPIYGGAGTNIKVLEAMQMQRPCVTTTYGVRGFSEYFADNKEILIAEDDIAFAAKIVALLNDEKQNQSIATKAYSAMKAHFSRKAFNEIIKNSLLSIC